MIFLDFFFFLVKIIVDGMIDSEFDRRRVSGLKRKVMNELIEWKNQKTGRMPLLLYGARQTGKTYILREFGETCFGSCIYVNFERMANIAGYFSGDLSPERILQFLSEYFNQKIFPEETLIIFDEIQACDRALTSLKYFCEDAPEYCIAAAGSLLGVAVHRTGYSFPVGKVQIKTLYPLTFDEFLDACEQSYLTAMIQECFREERPVPEAAHLELNTWYKRYLITGGMPAVINEYLRNGQLSAAADLQDLILSAYVADMTKYTSENEGGKIRSAFYSMPAQLAKDNRKFQYKLIRKGASAGLFGDSINWLLSAGTVISCSRICEGKIPLTAFRDLSAFKLYLSDVGLLCAFSRLSPENILREELSDTYRGALAENYTAQTLKAGGYDLYYWTNESPKGEVDFIIQKQGKVIPIEVKSGENVRSKSLMLFNKKYAPEQIYRLSAKNFGREGNLLSIPLYAAFCI